MGLRPSGTTIGIDSILWNCHILPTLTSAAPVRNKASDKRTAQYKAMLFGPDLAPETCREEGACT